MDLGSLMERIHNRDKFCSRLLALDEVQHTHTRYYSGTLSWDQEGSIRFIRTAKFEIEVPPELLL